MMKRNAEGQGRENKAKGTRAGPGTTRTLPPEDRAFGWRLEVTVARTAHKWHCPTGPARGNTLGISSQASGCSPVPSPSTSRLSEQLTAPLLARLPESGHQPWEKHMRRPVLKDAAP